MPKEIEMTIICENGEPIVIRDRKLIQKSWFLNRAAYAQDNKWLTKAIKFSISVHLPFPKKICEFSLKYAVKYTDARFGSREENLRKYKAANKKSLEELKQILSCASYLQCQTFMNAIGFVTAKKLEEKSAEEVQDYMGEGCIEAAEEFNTRTSEEERLKNYIERNKKIKAEHTKSLEQSTALDTSQATESLESSIVPGNKRRIFMANVRQRYNLNDLIWCHFWNGTIQKAHIIDIAEREGVMHYKVHYIGWNYRYQEWFSFEQAEILMRPFTIPQAA
ncbi:hypothetical protein CAEBREN_02268 [Caenorhabditis brenneri]|uniref:Tudor-knot domain-containing protein n=1 Tax=Caenorhabditis brenneri TaxID=135651 RepID=G0NKU3_CAEBE|nr:hypothetical protein CAEBREN_02268 [Caenorhabditis brenneri]